MPLELNQTLFLHLYGIINGLYVAAFLYIILFGISYYFKPNHRHIGITFLITALGYGCLGLYNLFFQHTHLAATHHIIKPELFFIAKFAAPVAMAVMTYIFIRLTILKSYRAYRLLKRHKLWIYSLYVVDLISFITLFFVKNSLFASFLILLTFVPHGIGMLYYSYLNRELRMISISVICLSGIIAMTLLTWVIYQNQLHLPPNIFFGLHTVFGFLLLCMSFMTIRYGYQDATRFFEIREFDSKQLASRIYQAIQENEFYMVYQPKVDLNTHKTCGFEALIRWQQPTLGNISPAEFIPIAEKTHLISHICRWSIDTVVKQSRILLDKGIDLPISINFSVRDVNPKIINFLEATLEKYHVPVSNIIIEITESLWMDMTEETSTALSMIYDLNIALSLDDYGTGFSSLRNMNELSLTEMKIDGSFIQDIETNTDNLVIVNSTLNMSNALNLKVTAEGVENTRTLSILKELGCDMAQGYGISKPLNAYDLLPWLTTSDYGYKKQKRATDNTAALVHETTAV